MKKPAIYILQVFASLVFLLSMMAYTVVVAKASFVSPDTVLQVIQK